VSAFQWVGRTGRELEDWVDDPFISDRLLATFAPIEVAYYAGKLDLVGLGKYAGQRMKWRAWAGFTAEDVASLTLEKMLAPKSEGGYGHVPPEDELWRKLAYKIIKHKVVDLMKLDKGDVLLDPELDDSELAEPVVQGWWSDATREWVESTCTEREASVLFLRFCLDWKQETVADFLSISQQAVSAHCISATDKLRVVKNTSQTLY
jgi:DNA-directed RNA polymerase specialized sigma24 family protein